MKPSFRKWTNPYIDKVESLPEFLAPCYGGRPNEDEREALRKRASSFRRIFCEFGCGSGRHLTEAASRDSSSFFAGFELRYKRAYKAAAKAGKAGLKNVFVMRTNVNLLPSLFDPGSLDGVYVNFPDPWDKKRWADHRMLNPDMLCHLALLLKSGGFLSYKTDHPERFHETHRLLENTGGWKVERYSEDLWNSEFTEDNIVTEFEGLFLSKRMKICFLLARRSV